MSSLRKTWSLLAVAAIAVLAVGFFTFRDLAGDVFARCKTGLVVESVDADVLLGPLDSVPLGDKSGFVLVYDRMVFDKRTGFDRYENVRLVTTTCGVATDGACACDEVRLRWVDRTLRAAPSDVRLYRHAPTGTYVVRAHPSTAYVTDEVIATFRRSATPTRRFVPANALAAKHVPSLVVVLAFGALLFGAFRAHRATAYMNGMRGWTEATLSHEGMLQDESGATLGVLASGRRHVPAGRVLVDPSSLGSGSIYRELPVVARRDVAAGAHSRWIEATQLRMRDARALAVISTACALLGLGARFLGG